MTDGGSTAHDVVREHYDGSLAGYRPIVDHGFPCAQSVNRFTVTDRRIYARKTC